MIDLSNGDAVHAVRAHGLLWLLFDLLDEQVVLRRIVKVEERHRRLLACIVLFVYLNHVQRRRLLVLLLESSTLSFTFDPMPLDTAQVNRRDSWALLDLEGLVCGDKILSLARFLRQPWFAAMLKGKLCWGRSKPEAYHAGPS